VSSLGDVAPAWRRHCGLADGCHGMAWQHGLVMTSAGD